MAIDPLTKLQHAQPGDTEAAGRALEAYFLRQVLAEVRGASEGGPMDGGFAGSTFKEMLDGALADSMAEGRGVGLRQSIERSMGGKGPSVALEDVNKGVPGIAPAGARMPTHGPLGAAPVAQPGALASPLPSRPEVTSPFGPREAPMPGASTFHPGLDLRAAEGTPVHAAGAGRVTFAGQARGYGNLVVVDHGGGVETRYGHLSKLATRAGAQLPAGGAVGEVGATGVATGPHLHFEVRRDGRAVDPSKVMGPKK